MNVGADSSSADVNLSDDDPEKTARQPVNVEKSGPWSVGFWEGSIDYMTPLGDVRSLRLLAWYPVVPDGDGPLDIDFVAGLYERRRVCEGGATGR